VERDQKRRIIDVEHLPLNDAAAAGNLGAVQSLVRKDPSILNKKDSNGWQAIHEGIYYMYSLCHFSTGLKCLIHFVCGYTQPYVGVTLMF